MTTIPWEWIERLIGPLERSRARRGEVAVLVHERASHRELVAATRLALGHLGAEVIEVQVGPERRSEAHPALATLGELGGLIVDCTNDGIGEAPDPEARVLWLAPRHPADLPDSADDPALVERVNALTEHLDGAMRLRILSDAGTDLVVRLDHATISPWSGQVREAGETSRFPAGMVVVEPAPATSHGTIVVSAGDGLFPPGTAITGAAAIAVKGPQCDAFGETPAAVELRARLSDRVAPAGLLRVGIGLDPEAPDFSAARAIDDPVDVASHEGNVLIGLGASMPLELLVHGHRLLVDDEPI